MSLTKLIFRNLFYFYKANIAVVLGVLISTAVLTGALLVGDSVKSSLVNMVNKRLGETEHTVVSQEKVFNASLAESISNDLEINVAPVLYTRGIVIKDGNLRLNKVNIYGINNEFNSFSVNKELGDISENTLFVNEKTAKRLNLKIGDELLIRLDKLSNLPKNAPFVSDDINNVSVRLNVEKILTEDDLGNFSLKAIQKQSFNIFLSLDRLSKLMEKKSVANILLASGSDNISINNSLKNHIGLESFGLDFKVNNTENIAILSSERVFLEDYLVEAATSAHNSANPVLSYFVNGIRKNDMETPYSFISAPGDYLDQSISENEIILNNWTAQDLSAKIGDTIEIDYYTIGALRVLKENTKEFVVKDIVEIKDEYANKDLTPNFPGLTDAGNCREWDAGVPIDMKKIRDKDEDYWNEYKGTPKAFINNKTAVDLWKNRFGSYTCIQYAVSDSINATSISESIIKNIEPSKYGFIITESKNEGLSAANSGIDFGQLFLSLSFIILIASTILTRLIFKINMDHRVNEIGTMHALGFTTKQIRNSWLLESLFLSIIGALLGIILSVFYNNIIINGLNSVWQGAVNTNMLIATTKVSTLIKGFAISVALCTFVIVLNLRKVLQKSISDILNKNVLYFKPFSKKGFQISSITVIAILLVCVAMLFSIKFSSSPQYSTTYFLIGFLILFGAIVKINAIMEWFKKSKSLPNSALGLALKNNLLMKNRSLKAISLMAIGVFVVFSTGANKLDTSGQTQNRKSGTGGFLFYGETTIPVLNDLNTFEGRDDFGIDLDTTLSFVQFKVLDGDDASCLNLNKILKPGILGVNPEILDQYDAFSFFKTINNAKESEWLGLNQEMGANTYPAYVDQSVAQWGMTKKIGDTLKYKDELGQPLNLIIAGTLENSIFQGSLIVSEEVFSKHYPSISGSNVMLINAPIENAEQLKESLSRSFRNTGLELENTAQRLAEFNMVQNTYLSIFLALGGLGLILGTLGIGIVIYRNILEAKASLALMRATGFNKGLILKILLIQNLFVLLPGILIGVFTAIVAVIPAILNSSSMLPYKLFAFILGGILLSGLIFIISSSVMLIKGKLVDLLRNE